MKKTSELLWEAKDYLEAHGWVQGKLQKGESVCAMGAVNAVCIGMVHPQGQDWLAELDEENVSLRRDRVYSALMARINEGYEWKWKYGDDGTQVANWNDDPGRTAEEVLELFEKTAIAMEEIGQ